MATNRTCELCLHYNALASDPGLGECRRYAPSLSLSRSHNENTHNKVRAQWGLVSRCDWCGDYFPRWDAPQDLIDWYMVNGHLF